MKKFAVAVMMMVGVVVSMVATGCSQIYDLYGVEEYEGMEYVVGKKVKVRNVTNDRRAYNNGREGVWFEPYEEKWVEYYDLTKFYLLVEDWDMPDDYHFQIIEVGDDIYSNY